MKMMTRLMCMALGALLSAGAAMGQATHVTISQVYGAGNNAGATWRNDFIELFNPTANPVTLTGMSVQYGSATGSTWSVTPLTGTIAPNSYFLVQEAGGTTNGVAIPLADSTGTINMSGTAGKVALVNSTIALTGSCPAAANYIDLVGFGATANCSETGVASAPSTTTWLLRASGGCTDNNNNGADFSITSTVFPRNTSSPTNACAAGNPPSGVGSASPNTPCPGTNVTYTVTTSPGTVPVAPITSVTIDFSAIGGSNAQAMDNVPLNSNTWTYSAVIAGTAQAYNFPVTITDSATPTPRTGSANIALTITSCNPVILSSGSSASPSGVCDGSTTLLRVQVQNGQNPTSQSFIVTGDLSAINGANPATFTSIGGNVYTYLATVPATGLAAGAKALPITATEDIGSGGRTATRTLNIVNAPCTNSASAIVISQVYGGGGNSGATLKDDFVELYNRSCTAVDLGAWSLQYSPVDGASGGFGGGTFNNNPVPLSGSVLPGHYFLIQLSRGAGGTQDLPTADLVPATANLIQVGSTGGIFALVEGVVTPLGTGQCANAAIRDLVGYGTFTVATVTMPSACYEGQALADMIGAVPSLSNTTAAIRNLGGCQDNDRNRIDFEIGTPNPRNSSMTNAACIASLSGRCCDPAGGCGTGTQAACVAGSTWTCGGTCTPNTCPVVGGGVCCRGATCTTTIASSAACTESLIGGQAAGASFPTGAACNTGGSTTTPCCYADYNKLNGIGVPDIFDFLADWFAGSTFANTGGNGGPAALSVTNIFDFLAAWFAGGC